MNSKQRNVLVGLVVLLALGMLTFMLLIFAGRATALFVRRGIPITLNADRADGLNEGAPVSFRGVTVGKVTKIRRSENNEQVILTAEVDPNPPLPGNVVGLIKTAGALSTGAEITLEQTSDEPGAAVLAPNAVIPTKYVGFTLLPPELTDLANQIRKDNLVGHLDETVLSIEKQVNKAGKTLDAMQSLISDPKMRANIQASIGNIRQFSDNLGTLESNANGTIVDMRATVNRTGSHIDDLSRNLDGSVQKLGAVLDQFQTAAAKINNGQGTAGLLVNDPRLYNSLADTAKELDQTIADLQRLVQQWEQEGVTLKLH
jgi:phospholipid/cholesterol/gamma-HCH transport system substrate-binding protein